MRKLSQPILVVLFLSLVLVYATNAGPTPPDRDNIVVDPNEDSPWEELSSNQDDNGADGDQQLISWKFIDNMVFHDVGKSILSFRLIINRNFISIYFWNMSQTKDEINKRQEVRRHK
jgi:hypothetical protein